MKYAIIQTGGKQYKVKEGDELVVEKLEKEEGKKYTFEKVLLAVENGKVRIGQPFLSGASVTGKITAHIKSDKIRVAIFKAKSRYRKVKGHRQQLTRVVVEKISVKKRQKTGTARK